MTTKRYELEKLIDNALAQIPDFMTASVKENDEEYTIKIIDGIGRQTYHDGVNSRIESILYGYTTVRGGRVYSEGYEVFSSEDDWNIFTAIHTFTITKEG